MNFFITSGSDFPCLASSSLRCMSTQPYFPTNFSKKEQFHDILLHSCIKKPFSSGIRSRGYKKFLLNSAEHGMKFFLLINIKMPLTGGISASMSRKNSILCLSVPENAEFLDTYTYEHLKFYAPLR